MQRNAEKKVWSVFARGGGVGGDRKTMACHLIFHFYFSIANAYIIVVSYLRDLKAKKKKKQTIMPVYISRQQILYGFSFFFFIYYGFVFALDAGNQKRIYGWLKKYQLLHYCTGRRERSGILLLTEYTPLLDVFFLLWLRQRRPGIILLSSANISFTI